MPNSRVTRPPRKGGSRVSKPLSRKITSQHLHSCRISPGLGGPCDARGQRSASVMIAAIKPIAVNQEMAEISSSILVPIGRPAALDRSRNLMQERRHRNIGEIADPKFSQSAALHRREKFLKSRRPVVEREHGGRQTESVWGVPGGRRVGLRRSHGLLGV